MRNERLANQLKGVRQELRVHMSMDLDDDEFKACYKAWDGCGKVIELLTEKMSQLPLPLDVDGLKGMVDLTIAIVP